MNIKRFQVLEFAISSYTKLHWYNVYYNVIMDPVFHNKPIPNVNQKGG